MNLWLIKAPDSNEYDTYDSAVVVALTEEDAKDIHPDGEPAPWTGSEWRLRAWTTPDLVNTTWIGEASSSAKAGTVICASFNAG